MVAQRFDLMSAADLRNHCNAFISVIGSPPHSKPPAWSFVIPCLNEVDDLPETMATIRSYAPPFIPIEIIVADHGSTDGTPNLAVANGARLVEAPGVSLGLLRNCGAAAARGEILIFLDADISLTAQWNEHVEDAVRRLDADPKQLVGSPALPRMNASWVARDWEFGRHRTGEVRSLPGGHLILRRDFFVRIGGFPEDVDAGEDEDLGRRVWSAGGRVRSLPDLPVVHRGAPESLSAFFHRQFWHGLGDAKSVRRFFRSPTALLAVAYTLLWLSLFPAFLHAYSAEHWAGVMFLILGILLIPVGLTVRRLHRIGTVDLLLATRLLLLFSLYLMARGLAVAARPVGLVRRKRRHGSVG